MERTYAFRQANALVGCSIIVIVGILLGAVFLSNELGGRTPTSSVVVKIGLPYEGMYGVREGTPVYVALSPAGRVTKVEYLPLQEGLAPESIVTTSRDTTTRLWNRATGSSVKLLNEHQDSVNSASFSPDAKYIVTASNDRTTRVWDVASGALLQTFEGHQDSVNSASFSPDAKYIVTASDDHSARLWDAASGTLLRAFEGHKESVNSASFSPDSKYIVTASDDHSASLWDAASGSLLRAFEGHKESVNSASFSPDANYIVTTSDDRTTRVWDAASGVVLRVFEGHQDSVNSASFSPDTKYIVTASDDHSARLWDAASGALLRAFEGHKESVNSASFSPDVKHIVTTSVDRTARVWDISNGASLHLLEGHQDSVTSASFGPVADRNESAIAFATIDQDLYDSFVRSNSECRVHLDFLFTGSPTLALSRGTGNIKSTRFSAKYGILQHMPREANTEDLFLKTAQNVSETLEQVNEDILPQVKSSIQDLSKALLARIEAIEEADGDLLRVVFGSNFADSVDKSISESNAILSSISNLVDNLGTFMVDVNENHLAEVVNILNTVNGMLPELLDGMDKQFEAFPALMLRIEQAMREVQQLAKLVQRLSILNKGVGELTDSNDLLDVSDIPLIGDR